MAASTCSPQSAAGPDLLALRAWLQACGETVTLFGDPARPHAIGTWYPTHLQTARLCDNQPLPLILVQTTFCAKPRRRAEVLPLLAQANQQLERGRWFLRRDPPRLTYAMELPASLIDGQRFVREWRRFYDEAVAHGIELTLRTRAVANVGLLRAKARQPAAH